MFDSNQIGKEYNTSKPTSFFLILQYKDIVYVFPNINLNLYTRFSVFVVYKY